MPQALPRPAALVAVARAVGALPHELVQLLQARRHHLRFELERRRADGLEHHGFAAAAAAAAASAAAAATAAVLVALAAVPRSGRRHHLRCLLFVERRHEEHRVGRLHLLYFHRLIPRAEHRVAAVAPLEGHALPAFRAASTSFEAFSSRYLLLFWLKRSPMLSVTGCPSEPTSSIERFMAGKN